MIGLRLVVVDETVSNEALIGLNAIEEALGM